MKKTLFSVVSMLAFAVLAADDSFKADCDKHLRALKSYGVHTVWEKVLKPVPDALAFIEAKAATHPAECDPLVRQCFVTLARGRDFESGVKLAEKTVANASASAESRLEATHYLAMRMLDKTKDFAAADRMYAELEKLPKLSPETRVAIAGYRAYLFTLREDKAGALGFLKSERARIEGTADYRRRAEAAFVAQEAEVYMAFQDRKGCFEHWLQAGEREKALKMVINGEVDELPRGDKLARECVKENGSPTAWTWLWGKDDVFCLENLETVLGKTRNSTNVFLNYFEQKVKQGVDRDPFAGPGPAAVNDGPWMIKSWELYDQICRTIGREPSFALVQYAVIAYATRDVNQAVRTAEYGLAFKNLKDFERFELANMIPLLKLKGRVGAEDVAAVEKAVAGVTEPCPEKERVKRFERACIPAMVCGDDALAHAIAKYYKAKVNPEAVTKTYDVRFSKRRVAGAGDWANLPFKPDESDFDRTFGGGSLAFLLTDVATGDRGNAVQGGDKARKYPTTLQAVTDEWGLHIVMTFYDRRAREFESGKLDCGSYECYLAPGENTPHACIMAKLKKDMLATVFNTTYDRPGHRRLVPTDPRMMRSETAYTDDAVICYLGFSWDNYATRIPEDGTLWEFESLFWGPTPSAWNGTSSIHGRSTWGKLRFSLDEAARTKILRAQLYKACNGYKAEKTPAGHPLAPGQEGVFDHWKDDAVGDPAFYDTCLKPLETELDAAAARVGVEMSDADVREVAAKYLARFRDIRYEVARLRTRYLETSVME